MSMFISQSVACPQCERAIEVVVVESVNADRRPDLRDEILASTFQIQTCPECEASFRVDPQFNYLDQERGQWISAQPLSELANWIEKEDEANAVFAKAYGVEAPDAARAIGDTLTPRLVFGWSALREKVYLADVGLDDTTAELSKLAIIRGLGDAPMQPGMELRVDHKDDRNLRLAWIEAQTNEPVESLSAPISLPEEIEDANVDWAPFREQLTDGPFVDIQKLWIGDGRGAA